MGSDRAAPSGFPTLALVLALGGILGTAPACTGAVDDLLPELDNYDFATSCADNATLEACSPCCDDLGYDTSIVATGDCGCSYQYSDYDVCEAADGDFDACAACCEASDEDSATNLRNGECRCLGIQPSQPAPDRRVNRCESSGDTCRCSRDTMGTCGLTGIPGDDSIVCVCSL